MTMKILITGAAGQLGQALIKAAATQGWEAVATDVAQMDITDPQAVAAHLARHRPEVVVNAAAATRVDDLEYGPGPGPQGQRPGAAEPGGGLPAPGGQS